MASSACLTEPRITSPEMAPLTMAEPSLSLTETCLSARSRGGGFSTDVPSSLINCHVTQNQPVHNVTVLPLCKLCNDGLQEASHKVMLPSLKVIG